MPPQCASRSLPHYGGRVGVRGRGSLILGIMSNLDMLLEGCRQAKEYEREQAQKKMPVALCIGVGVVALSLAAIVLVGGAGAFLLLGVLLVK